MIALKLAIVGGGSAYTPDILTSLLREPALFAGWEWILQDVDRQAVTIIAALARGLVRTAGAAVTVRWTLDLDEALTGARFVLAQPRPGGLAARGLDEKIPLRLGVIGQETVGPGGLSFAWRSIPVALDLAGRMQRLAPDGWLISYTNPAGMVTEAVIRHFPGFRFLGLCDMPTGVQWAAARLLRVDPHRLHLEYRGINHAGWIAAVRLDGGPDLQPRLAAIARWIPAAWFAPGEALGTVRLFREHGCLPDPYLRYYYYRDALLARLRGRSESRADVVQRRVRGLYTYFARQAAAERPLLRRHRGHASHGDLAAAVIRTLAAGRRERFIIQQANPGLLTGLPAGRAAQFPALVGPAGWEALPVPPLPAPVGDLIRSIQEAEVRNVDAALTGDRRAAVEAMAANPLVPSQALAERLVSELLSAHRRYLPQFFG